MSLGASGKYNGTKRKRVCFSMDSRGAIAVEVTIGAVLFLALVSFIFDFGLLVHKKSLLLDVTLKTAQELGRDSLATESEAVLNQRAREIFEGHATRLAKSWAGGLSVTEVAVDCDNQAITVSGQWPAMCAFCLVNRFEKALKSQSIAMIESSTAGLCPVVSETEGK